MRYFVSSAVRRIKALRDAAGNPLIEATTLCLHSDNAAQHFKSSKSLHWLSKQILEMGFTSVLWDFGPPGHGKVVFVCPLARFPFIVSIGRVGRHRREAQVLDASAE
jgi:hypothetical protein